uniref:Uncharacterized protein n=1 Tax=Panagrolaimus superbus TaxID=310955 RepID=A0A914Z0I1_9BILA
MEGYIIFQDLGNNNCHLESISREQPFKFEDDTQVLYLSNMRDNQNTNTHPCQWNFIAPHGFGFKVVIEIFEADAFTKIRIENTTDLLIK